MIQLLEELGMVVINYIILIGLVVGAIYVGAKIAARFGKILGLLGGFMVFIILGLMFYPIVERNDARMCKANPMAEMCD